MSVTVWLVAAESEFWSCRACIRHVRAGVSVAEIQTHSFPTRAGERQEEKNKKNETSKTHEDIAY